MSNSRYHEMMMLLYILLTQIEVKDGYDWVYYIIYFAVLLHAVLCIWYTWEES
jgi:hypothetical protein